MGNIIKMKSPLQVGMIEYGKTISDENGVYSIDRFTFNFRLSDTLYEAMQFSLTTWTWRHGNTDVEFFDAHRFGDTVKVMQFGKLHVEMWRGKEQRNGQPVNCMRLDFSPNHCWNHPVLAAIFAALNKTEETFTFDLSRVDFAYDIPLPIREVYVLSRKTEGNVGMTRYYGKRGVSGMLRVYDKRVEEETKNHKDIGREVTRLEWEQRGGKDLLFTFDTFCTADFEGLQYPASVIPYIEPQNINKAFCNISKNTRTSYRKLFKPYPFNAEHFKTLLASYYEAYGIMGRRWNYSESGTRDDVKERSESVTITLLPSVATMEEEKPQA